MARLLPPRRTRGMVEKRRFIRTPGPPLKASISFVCAPRGSEVWQGPPEACQKVIAKLPKSIFFRLGFRHSCSSSKWKGDMRLNETLINSGLPCP